MKYRLQLYLLFLISTASSFAQDNIIIGKKDTLFSKILNEKREIWVSVPSDYNKNIQEKSYPVVYVLDGPEHFLSIVGMIDRFSNNVTNEVCPPMIVVGLISENRWKDFNPDFTNDTFSRFLKDELIPYVDKNYSTKPFRTLIGHSLGGLRVVHTALYNSELFNNYIAIEPGLGNERNKWFNKAKPDIDKLQLQNHKMYLAMGQTMPFDKVQDTSGIKRDTTSDSNHMRKIMEFSEAMKKKNVKGNYLFNWKFYPEENHQSLTQIAIFDGFKFVFDWYKNNSWDEIFDPNTKPDKTVQLFRDYYSKVSNNLSYKVVFSDNSELIDYFFNYKNQKEKAFAIAKYNLECHPNDSVAKDWVDKISKELKMK